MFEFLVKLYSETSTVDHVLFWIGVVFLVLHFYVVVTVKWFPSKDESGKTDGFLGSAVFRDWKDAYLFSVGISRIGFFSRYNILLHVSFLALYAFFGWWMTILVSFAVSAAYLFITVPTPTFAESA